MYEQGNLIISWYVVVPTLIYWVRNTRKKQYFLILIIFLWNNTWTKISLEYFENDYTWMWCNIFYTTLYFNTKLDTICLCVCVCLCIEGPMSHDQPTYASVPGIRVYGMMCVQGNRKGRPLRYKRGVSGMHNRFLQKLIRYTIIPIDRFQEISPLQIISIEKLTRSLLHTTEKRRANDWNFHGTKYGN